MEFYSALKDAWDPEEKRKIIGRLFVKVQAKVMHELGIDDRDWFLGQGTIFPDTIESGGSKGKAALIKTHHNRCAEIQALLAKGRVVEPLADLYKDDVRQVGRDLGLSESLLTRWPFPGPGLAIRILCIDPDADVGAKPVQLPKLAPYKAYEWPVKTVGVQGDARTYKKALVLQGPLDYEQMQERSSHCWNTNQKYNRVAYVVKTARGVSIAKAKVMPAKLVPERVRVLQDADRIVRRIAAEEELLTDIWQFPVILLPVRIAGREVVVLRPVDSRNGMTASFTRLQPDVLYRIADEIIEQCEVGAVLLDITAKPPATIEWE